MCWLTTSSVALSLCFTPVLFIWSECAAPEIFASGNKKKKRENNNNLLLSFHDILKAKLSASPLVCSPWDQSGWRCERGRCRCSRSQQRGELHRPSRASRASRARTTHGAPMRVASAGAAAVAAPGRSPSPARELALSWPSVAQRGRRYCTEWLSVCSSRFQLASCVVFGIFFSFFAFDLRSCSTLIKLLEHVESCETPAARRERCGPFFQQLCFYTVAP